MVAADKEGAFYYGDPELVSKFFSQGISKSQIEKEINVRPVGQYYHVKIGCLVKFVCMFFSSLFKTS